MNNRSHESGKQILATDLDGTLIPLDGRAAHVEDLQTLAEALRENGVPICFASGRHFEIILDAIATYRLPTPDWIICDVGTTILSRSDERYAVEEAYRQHLQDLMGNSSFHDIQQSLNELGELRLQEEEKQGEFKLSFYTDATSLSATVEKVRDRLGDTPVSLIDSVDPFTGDGLIDLLPAGTSKAYALNWWADAQGVAAEEIVYAGDSGNDLAAFQAGFRSIVVRNAPDWLADEVARHHASNNWTDRFYRAESDATSGVFEGCRHFGLIRR
ncbi:Mannosylfructose-phosphate phosphatase [Thalassoglobus neptunius]|uniref:Mannosylfructose-phosphate phosphatase n=1 Tax=Thalassoglobus neptunius TaxID=1938619 RepID=A0A5C5XA06_9PLAN|nr:HAD-IIB family hydrolase [Thalassoglobus neptunius]TWT59015.1 Mannosylfructose-phosphate phosphatase [Thalassoglobus neptunius]